MWHRSSSSSFEVRHDSGGGRVAVMRTFALKDSLGVVGGAGGGVASLDSCRVLSFSFRNRANTFNERVDLRKISRSFFKAVSVSIS